MMELDITFEETPWEQRISALSSGDSLDGLDFLALTQDMEEDELQLAFLQMQERGIALDITRLPVSGATGKDAPRLLLEQKLVKQADLRQGLEENDPLKLFLDEIAAIPAAGDVNVLADAHLSGDEAAADKLAKLSLSRCVELAKGCCGYGVLLLDLIQEACLGLWQSILTYDGGGFEVSRDWWIRQYLAKAVLTQARAGDVGQKIRTAMEDYRDVDQKLLSELGRNPTLEEIAQGMHISPEEAAVYAGMVDAARSRQRIEEARQEKEPTQDDELAVEDTAYFQSRQRIMELLSQVTPQEAELLSMRFGLEGGLPLTPEQTGAKLGLTAREVVEMEAAALAKLRNQ